MSDLACVPVLERLVQLPKNNLLNNIGYSIILTCVWS